jgi:hypothetical protein
MFGTVLKKSSVHFCLIYNAVPATEFISSNTSYDVCSHVPLLTALQLYSVYTDDVNNNKPVLYSDVKKYVSVVSSSEQYRYCFFTLTCFTGNAVFTFLSRTYTTERVKASVRFTQLFTGPVVATAAH